MAGRPPSAGNTERGAFGNDEERIVMHLTALKGRGCVLTQADFTRNQILGATAVLPVIAPGAPGGTP